MLDLRAFARLKCPRSSSNLFGSLRLGGLCRFSLPPPLGGFGARLRVHHVVPPSEAAGIVANEPLMVNIVMVRTGPEWQEMVQAPRKLVSTVRIDSLEKAENDPNVHGQDMKIACDGAVEDRAKDRPETK